DRLPSVVRAAIVRHTAIAPGNAIGNLKRQRALGHGGKTTHQASNGPLLWCPSGGNASGHSGTAAVHAPNERRPARLPPTCRPITETCSPPSRRHWGRSASWRSV